MSTQWSLLYRRNIVFQNKTILPKSVYNTIIDLKLILWSTRELKETITPLPAQKNCISERWHSKRQFVNPDNHGGKIGKFLNEVGYDGLEMLSPRSIIPNPMKQKFKLRYNQQILFFLSLFVRGCFFLAYLII